MSFAHQNSFSEVNKLRYHRFRMSDECEVEVTAYEICNQEKWYILNGEI